MLLQIPVLAQSGLQLTHCRAAAGCSSRGKPPFHPASTPPHALHPHSPQIATWRHNVYIHCANGHGRSTSLAALVLVYRGEFRTWREAFTHIQGSRLLAKFHVNQEQVMDTAQQLLDLADASDEEPVDGGVSAEGSPGSNKESIVRRASSVQRRPFKFVRAASDGGVMEVKPSAPQDAAIVAHYKRTGRAIASRAELDAGEPSASAGVPKPAAVKPPSSAHSGLAEMDAGGGSTSPLAGLPAALLAHGTGGAPAPEAPVPVPDAAVMPAPVEANGSDTAAQSGVF